MTEKEEKAIEEIKPWLEFEKNCECNKGILLLEYIDTVIQALEQKDKEIQELKADLYECNNIISDYIDTVKEKDKTIKLMAKFMNKRSWKEHQLKDDDCYCCKIEYSSKECVDCIIGYFQKKAREEND